MRYFVFILLILSCYLNIACTCVGERKFSNQFRESDAVFLGKVIMIDTVFYVDTLATISVADSEYMIHTYSRLKAIIQVKKWYKTRDAKCEFISVYTESQSSMCMVDFESNRDYIIYCKCLKKVFDKEPKRENFFYTDKCTRTQLSNQEELDLLNSLLK